MSSTTFCPLEVSPSVDTANVPAQMDGRTITIQSEMKDALLHLAFFSEDLGDATTIILTPFLNGKPYVQPVFDGRPAATGYVLSRNKEKRHLMVVALHFPELAVDDVIAFVAQKSDMAIDDASRRHDYAYAADAFEPTQVPVTIATVGPLGLTTVKHVTTSVMEWANARLQKGQKCTVQADMLYAALSLPYK